ncbi:DUF475 domain-containing protein [Embleya scabrispora]|uniref:DUF475 domain-containing protein n=1 Tax=Embleya scabrispora TaxID=159449 RepID=UPI00039FC6CC|nr:DUF475 domain-containing protein [Embleya scabrispora]MYS82781.1 DUF475 domain-containing protein [Streptomyces sp. SID5474]
MVIRTFGWSFAVTAVGLAVAAYFWGATGFGIVLILSILEISLSFDNAVVNATILKKMNAFWQKMFLTVGILIAVFGMRLVFPLLIVSLTAGIGPVDVVDLAFHDDKMIDGMTYAQHLDEAHPAIAAFGGMFLLMIFLDFMFDDEREHRWIGPLERFTGKLGNFDVLSTLIALITLVVVAQTLSPAHKEGTVMVAGVLGLIAYLGVGGLSDYFETHGTLAHINDEEDEDAAEAGAEPAVAEGRSGPKPVQLAAGKAAFFMFLYLEVLDASFSFDGVVGAFAITQDLLMITLGLGIGAMYIRSLTVYLVRQGTLDDYVYLEHGAMYAIGALATILLVSIKWEIHEVITGVVGVGFIGIALISSIMRNKRIGHVPGQNGGAAKAEA